MNHRLLERHARLLGVAASTLIISSLALGATWGIALGVAGVALLLLLAYSPGDGLLVLGPYAEWELIRSAKRRSLFVYRGLICALVLFIIGLHFSRVEDWWQTSVAPVTRTSMAYAAHAAFYALLSLLGVITWGFALFQLPSIITEEKESKRLEHVLVTDLRNREILFGKLGGRSALLLMYVGCVFPILALLLHFGGIDPTFFIVAFVLFVFSYLGIAGVAAGVSAIAGKASGAVFLTLTLMVLHLIVTQNLHRFPILSQRPAVLNFFEDGNIFSALRRIEGNIGDWHAAQRVMRHYAANQMILGTLGWLIAVSYIRRDGRRDGGRAARGVLTLTRSPIYRPPVSDQPIVWFDLTGPLIPLTRMANKWVLRLWWFPAIIAAVGAISIAAKIPNPSRTVPLNFLISSGLAWFVICVPTAWHASRGIVGERQRDTMEALLLTDLEPREILWQKWLSAILCGRALWSLAVGFWLTGVLLGYIQLVNVIACLIATAAATLMTASLGVLSSVHSKTMGSAFAKLALVWCGWSFIIYMVFCCGAAAFRGAGSFPLLFVFLGAVSPPGPMIAASLIDITQSNSDNTVAAVAIFGFGTLIAVVVAHFSYQLALSRFTHQTRPRLNPVS